MPTPDPRHPTRRSQITTTAVLLSTLVALVALVQACDGGGTSNPSRDASLDQRAGSGGAASGGTKGGVGGSGVGGTTGPASGGVGGNQTGTGGAGGTTIGSGGASTGGVGGKGGTGGGTGGQSSRDASPSTDASPILDISPIPDGGQPPRDALVSKDSGSADSASDRDAGFADSAARDSNESPPDVPVNMDGTATDSSASADAPPSASLNDCFAGLPAPVGTQILSNKSSSDGRVRVRLALDTLGNMGLGYAWNLIRFGIEIDGSVTCIKDKADLKYTMSRHNCDDTASASTGTTRYEMSSPSDITTSLRIFEGATQTDSLTLTTDSCVRTGSTAACPPTGPC